MGATVEFFGETYALTGAVSEFALLEFAEAAADGQDGDTMQGMASIMRLLRDCIAKEPTVDEDGTVVALGWASFRTAARANHASVERDLMPVIQQAFEAQADRPTGRPSDSSDGPALTAPSAASPSADRGMEHFRGRPDLQLQLIQGRKAG